MSDLGSLLTLEYGVAMPTEARSGHGFPVFGSNGEVGRHSRFLIGEPGIIVGRKGSAGKVTWADEPFWPIDTTYWVKCTSEDRRWIYWVLNWLPLNQLDSSTGIPGLNRNDVYALSFYRPKLSERHKVAKILDTLDTAIHETEAIIAKLKAVKLGLLHDLLTRGIDANGELRPPQAEAPHLYKESPLGWIPKEWKISGLAAVAPKDRPVIRTGPFGSSLKGEHWRESGTPVVTIGSLGDGVFVASELLFVDVNTADRLNDFRLIPGDLVFSRVADVGRSVVISEDERGWIMSSNFMRISCSDEKVRSHFVQLLMSSSLLVRNQLRATVNSAGRDVANSSVLLGLCFTWPSISEQDQILSKVRSIDMRLSNEDAKLRKLSEVKLGLMDDLLTGRVRVTPLLAAESHDGSA